MTEGRPEPLTVTETSSFPIETNPNTPSLKNHTTEDLKTLIQTYRNINIYLDSQVDRLQNELEQIKSERDSWKEFSQTLTRALQKRERQNLKPEDLVQDIDHDRILKICNSIVEDISETEAERDGVVIEKLVARGMTSGWFVDPNEIVLLDLLGEGTFGKTYLARWHGGDVCVKCMKIEEDRDRVSFLREIEALSSLRHPNILPFLGASIQKPDKFWLVCEYMSGGTLSRWLYGDQAKSQPLAARLAKSLDIAKGMEACEKSDPQIVHRDIKPSNVFIDAEGQARIGDFGLARRLNPEGRSFLTGETGTYVYMSPEMINHELYTSATDVWSWGIITCELITKNLPYAATFFSPVQVAKGVSDGSLRPALPKDLDIRLMALLESATAFDPNERPSFEHIVREMDKIVADLKSAMTDGIVTRFFKNITGSA